MVADASMVGGGRIVVKHKGRLVPVPYLSRLPSPEGIDGLEIQVVNLRKNQYPAAMISPADSPRSRPLCFLPISSLSHGHILFSLSCLYDSESVQHTVVRLKADSRRSGAGSLPSCQSPGESLTRILPHLIICPEDNTQHRHIAHCCP